MGRVSIFISFAICMISIWQTCDADHSKIQSPCPGPVYCSDNTPCKADEACLLPRFGTVKRCRKCYCSDPTQCYTDVDGSVLCDCTNSTLSGPFCTCQPCLGSCPPGFVRYDGTCSCYAVYQGPLSWMDAKNQCFNSGAFLVKISSDGENAFVDDLIKTVYNTNPDQKAWLGGNDLDVEGEWVWDMDTSPINGMYSKWRSPNPNNWMDVEHCLEMYINGAYDGLWNDRDCTAPLGYVCEYNP